MLREAVLIFLGILLSLKFLFEFQGVDLIGRYLPTFSALLLVYPPVIHVTLKRYPLTFFEKNLSGAVSSLFLFVVTSLVLFPLFLLLNHGYQKLLLEKGMVLMPPHFTLQQVAVQLFLVAFPEEFFFRGYLQTLLQKAFPKKLTLGIKQLQIGWAVLITSFLFAAAHSFIALRWWHFAIFFPGLVFGWLREKTNGLVAPILFHAVSNLLVAWIGNTYP